ncbi:hypothetical protein LTR37_010226 [Vermiconidia calcicola]|uniref:Uncharacterized protein n=1 Tax=Vermiconidia calcicola TaxID=1690605 RepID=A0ACC3N6A1_9PEZI|nr:hypothetical protein LTR37_010226 [Vermiconidia calcicola]
MWEKLKCALRLLTTARGIGWNWQVNGVPPHHKVGLGRTNFTRQFLGLALVSWMYKMPGVRLASLLSLKKGTIGSTYLQLYVAFTLSMLLHEWYIFNAVRHDAGEFWFFMLQPLAISVEDFAQWCSRRSGTKYRWPDPALRAVAAHFFTFMWFSYCLPPFIEGLLDAGIVSGDYRATQMLSLGHNHAVRWLQR